MNVRLVLILAVLIFIVLVLVIGVRTVARWLRIHYPRRANAILAGLAVIVIGTGVLVVLEMTDQPTFRPNDLITLQEPVVAKTIAADRQSRVGTCVVDLREHLGVLEVDIEAAALRVLVESNNSSEPVFCSIGEEVIVPVAWLRRLTVTHRQDNIVVP
ncbi:MAG: hypothetical protein R3B37_11905 [Nitrospira sp.]|nr:hypothetical protein [Nitrospira sp.]